LRRATRYAAAFGACLLLLPAGCVTSTQATRLQKDLDDVKRQLFSVQQDTTGSRARIDEISGKLGGGAGGGPSAQPELQRAIQGLIDQIQALNERMDEMKARMATLSQEIQALRPSASRAPQAQDGAPAGSAASPRPGGEASDTAFKTAYADYSKGNYELAVMGFGEFLKSYPGHPMAADAQYWIGECLYSAGKYKEAVEAMDRVAAKYPVSEKIPAALLKKGYAQIESGQSSAAVATLQQLAEKYPQTDEARLAAERLKQLGLRAR
jgi:tol-pal system protein YbgF